MERLKRFVPRALRLLFCLLPAATLLAPLAILAAQSPETIRIGIPGKNTLDAQCPT